MDIFNERLLTSRKQDASRLSIFRYYNRPFGLENAPDPGRRCGQLTRSDHLHAQQLAYQVHGGKNADIAVIADIAGN